MRSVALPLTALVFSVASLASVPARAELTLPGDSGVTSPAPTEEKLWQPPALPFHDSWFVWEHAATAETLGVGPDTQSRNPTYEMTFRLVPRYYLRDEPRWNTSVRADLRLVHEVTNSDTTTSRGEWDLVDTPLWLSTGWIVDPRLSHKTEALLRLPYVILPTSRASWLGGRGFGLGVGAELLKKIPLRKGQAFLPGTLFWPSLVYDYRVAGSTVATNGSAERVRVDPGGQAIPSDQLSGSALPQHELAASIRFDTQLAQPLTLVTQLAGRYARRYALSDSVEVCGVVATGCTEVSSREGASRWSVSTVFLADLSYAVTPYFEVGVGYENLAQQLGPNGRRRNVFYSPEARGTLSFVVVLDLLYQAARGQPLAQEAASSTPATAF